MSDKNNMWLPEIKTLSGLNTHDYLTVRHAIEIEMKRRFSLTDALPAETVAAKREEIMLKSLSEHDDVPPLTSDNVELPHDLQEDGAEIVIKKCEYDVARDTCTVSYVIPPPFVMRNLPDDIIVAMKHGAELEEIVLKNFNENSEE